MLVYFQRRCVMHDRFYLESSIIWINPTVFGSSCLSQRMGTTWFCTILWTSRYQTWYELFIWFKLLEQTDLWMTIFSVLMWWQGCQTNISENMLIQIKIVCNISWCFPVSEVFCYSINFPSNPIWGLKDLNVSNCVFMFYISLRSECCCCWRHSYMKAVLWAKIESGFEAYQLFSVLMW